MDDCRADALGCYGNPHARTPHLDRLAASGVRFEGAYAQAVSCNPSRTSFLTGLRPPTTGVQFNYQNARLRLPRGVLSLPQVLDRADFVLANVGKLFHGGEKNAGELMVFDLLELCTRPDGWEGPAEITAPPPPGVAAIERPEPDTPERAEFRRQHMDRWGDSGLTPEEERDARAARAAAEIVRILAADGRRFFLSFGTALPHAPLLCPAPYLARQDPGAVTVPPGRDADRGVPPVAVRYGQNVDVFVGRSPQDAEARGAIAAYHACVSFADAQIGRVLDALGEAGVADETAVVLISDHGFHLGEHGHWSKYTLFEQSTRVPLIVRVPGAKGNGRPAGGIAELVDLMPTLGDVLGVEMPPGLEGTSFAPRLDDPGRAGKRAAFTWLQDGQELQRSVRTERHRHTRWEVSGEPVPVLELYDLEVDPGERVNRAGDPELTALQAELAALLEGAREPTRSDSRGAR